MEAQGLGALDMRMDFEARDTAVRAQVLDRWDHAALLQRDDLLVPAIAAVQAAAQERLVLFAQKPTAEVLAREAFDAIAKCLPEGVAPVSGSVWEAPTSCKEYGP